MDHRKWWIGLSGGAVIVFFSSFAGSLFHLQALSQESEYIREQLAELKIQVNQINDKFTNFLTTEARFHADKKETYDLISILLKQGPVNENNDH